MQSFEKPSQEKWNNSSTEKCKYLSDLLNILEKVCPLPEGKTSNDESLKTVGSIMDYGERVLDDDQFWASIPEEIPLHGAGAEGYSKTKEDVKNDFSKIIEESK